MFIEIFTDSEEKVIVNSKMIESIDEKKDNAIIHLAGGKQIYTSPLSDYEYIKNKLMKPKP